MDESDSEGHLTDALKALEGDAWKDLDDLEGDADVIRERGDAILERGDAILHAHPRTARVARVARQVMKEQSQEQVSLAASGAAFWLIISAFPIAIAAVSIFGLVFSPDQVARDLSGLAGHAPQSLGAILEQQLTKTATADHAGLSLGVVVSVVLAVWSASRGVFNLDRAIRTAYGLSPERYVRGRGRAIVGALVVVVAVGLVALISSAIAASSKQVPSAVAVLLGVPVFLVLLGGGAAAGYRFSIGRELERIRIMPGAAASAIGLAMLAVVFVTYIETSASYAALYGALAGTVIGMVGTYLAVFVILIGAVLNAQMSRTN